jgi:hypothetical protein
MPQLVHLVLAVMVEVGQEQLPVPPIQEVLALPTQVAVAAEHLAAQVNLLVVQAAQVVLVSL